MQDRPTAPELLEAIEEFLRDRSTNESDRYFRFQFLVAANSLAIVRREWEQEEGYLHAEWDSLNTLLGAAPTPSTMTALRAALLGRNDNLCQRIREAEFDEPAREGQLLDHLVATTRDKLRITSPAQAAEPA